MREFVYNIKRLPETVTYKSGGSNGSGVPADNIPIMVASPDTMDLGNVPVGVSVTRNLRVFNMGQGSLTVSQITVSGAASLQIPTQTFPFTLNANEQRDINLQITPTGTSSGTGELSISSNDPETPLVTLPITFTGNDNSLTLPESVMGVSGTSGSRRVVLSWVSYTNLQGDFSHYNIYRSTAAIAEGPVGGASVLFSTSNLAVSGYTDESVSNGTTYYYAATVVDTYGNESLIVAGSKTGPLMPTFANPQAVMASAPLDFGAVPVGTVSGSGAYSDMSFTISNTGAADLKIYRAYNQNGFVFDLTDFPAESFIIVPGASRSFTVRLYAGFPGLLEGKVVFITNDPENPRLVKKLQAVGNVSGTVRYVSKTGGGSFTTIQSAINSSNVGDTIIINDSSTYIEDIDIGLNQAQTLSYLTIKAASGMHPIIQGSAAGYAACLIFQEGGIRLEGLKIQSGGNGIWAYGNNTPQNFTVMVIDCEISQTQYGILGTNGGNILAANNLIMDNSVCGINLAGQYNIGQFSGNTFRNNANPSALAAAVILRNSATGRFMGDNIFESNDMGVFAQNDAYLILIDNDMNRSQDASYADAVYLTGCNNAGSGQYNAILQMNRFVENKETR